MSSRSFLASALSLYCSISAAAPFGNSVLGTTTYNIPPCTAVSNASMPVAVDTSSRIFVTITGSAVSADTNFSYYLITKATLNNASDTVQLASGYPSEIGLFSAFGPEKSFSASSVLFDSSSTSQTPYTLLPGNYVLHLTFQAAAVSTCSGNGVQLETAPVLSYILLSSVLDRIFANGFS